MDDVSTIAHTVSAADDGVTLYQRPAADEFGGASPAVPSLDAGDVFPSAQPDAEDVDGKSALGASGRVDLTKTVTLAFGVRKDDMCFRNATVTLDQMNGLLSDNFKVGEKGGTCVLQGELVGTGQRIKANMVRNHVLIVDLDNGTSLSVSIGSEL